MSDRYGERVCYTERDRKCGGEEGGSAGSTKRRRSAATEWDQETSSGKESQESPLMTKGLPDRSRQYDTWERRNWTAWCLKKSTEQEQAYNLHRNYSLHHVWSNIEKQRNLFATINNHQYRNEWEGSHHWTNIWSLLNYWILNCCLLSYTNSYSIYQHRILCKPNSENIKQLALADGITCPPPIQLLRGLSRRYKKYG